VTVAGASRALSLSTESLRRYLRAGILEGIQTVSRHYADERVRKTGRGRWLISVASLERWLAERWTGDASSARALRWLRSRAVDASGASIGARGPKGGGGKYQGG